MDIKKAVSAIIPTQVERVARVERSIKTDSTTDRDANGQQAQGGSDQNKEPLSNEEMEKVLEYLKNLTVVKDHQLQVLLVMREKKKFVLDKISNTKAKTYRLPLLLSSIGLLVIGALLIFLAYNTIGYLGFIIGVIGIIALIVWLIFKEGENL